MNLIQMAKTRCFLSVAVETLLRKIGEEDPDVRVVPFTPEIKRIGVVGYSSTHAPNYASKAFLNYLRECVDIE